MRIFLITLFVFSRSIGRGNEQVTETSNMSVIAGASSLIKDLFPASSVSCAVDKMAEIYGPKNYTNNSVGTSNKGLNAYYQNFLNNNQCFAEIADSFWSGIRGEEETRSEEPRPLLWERAGRGRFLNHQPGWLWVKAMETTSGNSTLAMALLGMCTNDDMTPSFSYSQADMLTRNDAKRKLDELQRAVNELRSKQKGLESSNPTYQNLEKDIENRFRDVKAIKADMAFPSMARRKRYWQCPGRNSVAFVPRAVDATFDLPIGLKSEVLGAQSHRHPKRLSFKDSTIPAKSYHYTGGAITGCELVKCGVTPEFATMAAGLVAVAYRAARLCPRIKRLIKTKKDLEKELRLNSTSQEFWTRTLEHLSTKVTQGRLSEEEKKDKINGIPEELTQIDAATLFEKWYLGGASDSILPCTHLRTAGPVKLSSLDRSEACAIAGWTPNRCGKAIAKLRTWDVDFAWTKYQHEAGARFGAARCHPGEDSRETIDRVCAVYKAKTKRDGTSSAPAATVN
jgi:hypothetical protein